MKIANFKALATKVVAGGLLAGALAFAAPAKAEAQVTFGVRFGGPVYVAPPIYRRPVFYGPAVPYRHEEFFAPRYDRFHHGYWR